MKSHHVALLLAFCLLGCAPIQDIHPVWTKPSTPPLDMPAPEGFTITPAQAYSVVWDARALSLKHNWDIYSDSRYYYVLDTFLGSGPQRAFKQGIRVDGRTGEIVAR